MNKYSLAIIVAIVVAIITYLLTSAALRPRPSLNLSTAAGAAVIPLDVVSIHENSSSSPTINVEYPQFPSLTADFNAEISSTTLNKLSAFRQAVIENDAARKATDRGYQPAPIPPAAYSFIASWQSAQINNRFVSLVERYGSYTGGANGSQEISTFNYDAVKNRTIALPDLFASTTNYLSKISAAARDQLESSLAVTSAGHTPTAMIEAGTAPDLKNFQSFTFTDSSITFYFPKYAVAPGYFGEQQVTIAWNALK